MYSNKVITKVNKLILPMNGIDPDGYIYGTLMKLEDFYKYGIVDEIYTGYRNIHLEYFASLYNTKLHYFYQNKAFVNKEIDIHEAIIKSFLEEKLSSTFTDISVLVVGSSNDAYLMSKRLNAELNRSFMKSEDILKYDAIIHYDSNYFCSNYNKIVIDMNDGECLDFYFLFNIKELYFMKHLLSQYMTKSSAKLMYDCMCLNDSI